MQSAPALISSDTPIPQPPATKPLSLPDNTQLPDSDGTFVFVERAGDKNFQEHPQSIVLTSSIEPVLQKLYPDGQYCIGQDSGIYWRLTEPAEKGAEAPDWFYVPDRLAKQQAEQKQQQAEQKAARLAERLRAMGIDPNGD